MKIATLLRLSLFLSFYSLAEAMIHYTPAQQFELRLWGPDFSVAHLIDAVVKEGAVNIHLGFQHNETPLHIAAGGRNEYYVRILLKNGADIKAVDENNDTALYNAVIGGDKGIISLLINAGIEVNHQNGRGNTVLHLVERLENDSQTAEERHKYQEVKKLLKAAGARDNIPNNEGETPSQIAEKIEPEVEEFGPYLPPTERLI